MKKIIKPPHVGLLHKPYSLGRQHYFSVTNFVYFSLGQDSEILLEPDQWPKILASLPPQQVFDECMKKQTPEVLIYGSAYSEKPCTEMMIRVQCGDVDKSLKVVGDRDWFFSIVPFLRFTPTENFRQMKVSPTQAWGGEDFDENPWGSGHTPTSFPWLTRKNRGQMPNIQYPDQVLHPGKKNHRVAGFGSLHLNNPLRQQYSGTYNKQWLKDDFPGLAKDTDWDFFNMAPKDQWLGQSLDENTQYKIEGMHPEYLTLEGHLPDYVPRSFIQKNTGEFREIPVHADTLFLLPDYELGILAFHGDIEITDNEARDVDHLICALEEKNLPRTASYYSDVLAQRLVPENNLASLFGDTQLVPDSVQADAWSHPLSVEPKDGLLEEFQKETGMSLTAEQLEDAPSGEPELKFDPTTESISDFVVRVQALAEEKRQQLAEQVPETEAELVEPEEALFKADPELELAQMISAIQSSEVLDAPLKQQIVQNLQAIWKLKEEQLKVAVAPASGRLSESACRQLSDWIRSRNANKQSLAGLVLSGVKLDGVDFQGKDLSNVNFEASELVACSFLGASLPGSSFVGASLKTCDFRNANLIELNLSAADIHQCDFSQSDLTNSRWVKSKVSECELKGVSFGGTNFQDSKVESCDFSESSFAHTICVTSTFNQVSFSNAKCFGMLVAQCDLKELDCTNAMLERCAWLSCNTQAAKFDRANLKTVFISGEEGKSLWLGSSWRNAKIEDCGFRRSVFKGANFSNCVVLRSDLGESDFTELEAKEALFGNCLLAAGDFSNGDFSNADFCSSSLRKANFKTSNLRNASLYAADVIQVEFEDALVDGMNPEFKELRR